MLYKLLPLDQHFYHSHVYNCIPTEFTGKIFIYLKTEKNNLYYCMSITTYKCTVTTYWIHLLTLVCSHQTMTAHTQLTTTSTYVYTHTFNILHLKHSYDGATCVYICNV